MCILFWALEHPDYALILCTNRDEYLERPTQNAHFHSFEHEVGVYHGHQHPQTVLSGRDETAGGSWLGLNRSGRVALLTNITEPPSSSKQVYSSRGHLVSAYLLSDSSLALENAVEKIVPRGVQFAGFNLLLLAPEWGSHSVDQLRFGASLITNGGSAGTVRSRILSSEERLCGGFSNGVDGRGGNDWPKVKHGLTSFEAAIQTQSAGADEAVFVENLFEVLAWRSPEAVRQRIHLRKTIHVPAFNMTPSLEEDKPENDDVGSYYGTRLSTVLLITRNGQVLFVERDIWKLADGKPVLSDPSSQRTFRFQIAKI